MDGVGLLTYSLSIMRAASITHSSERLQALQTVCTAHFVRLGAASLLLTANDVVYD